MTALSQPPDNHDWLGSPRRILFPTDFGGAAQRAWSYALALAQALAAEILVLHVVELVAADFEGCAGLMGVVAAEGSLLRAVEGPLERMRAEAAAAGVHCANERGRGARPQRDRTGGWGGPGDLDRDGDFRPRGPAPDHPGERRRMGGWARSLPGMDSAVCVPADGPINRWRDRADA